VRVLLRTTNFKQSSRISSPAFVRHAGPTRAHVRLFFGKKWAVLEAEENGRGMTALPDLAFQAEEGRYGLAGIQERAEAIKGDAPIVVHPRARHDGHCQDSRLSAVEDAFPAGSVMRIEPLA
jgi:hypothetical protein